MAGLEGTVKTPFGTISKKSALYVGMGVAGVAGIVWYRHKQLGTTVDSTATDTTEIDPATGYAFGSPEDAAALSAQGSYTSPATATGGGSSSIPTTGTGFTSNGAWVQGVIEYMTTNGLVEDPSALSSALGVYTTGAYATDAQVNLIQQAIAVQGFPPVSGSTGYPPSINRNPPQTTTPPPGGTSTVPAKPVAIKGLRALRIDKGGVSLDWTPASGVIGYKTMVSGKQVGNSVVYSAAYVELPKPGTKYTVGVAGIWPGNKVGPTASIPVTTKK
jgi:hypothetical protein